MASLCLKLLSQLLLYQLIADGSRTWVDFEGVKPEFAKLAFFVQYLEPRKPPVLPWNQNPLSPYVVLEHWEGALEKERVVPFGFQLERSPTGGIDVRTRA